jgi:ribosome maturation factor RimP
LRRTPESGPRPTFSI